MHFHVKSIFYCAKMEPVESNNSDGRKSTMAYDIDPDLMTDDDTYLSLLSIQRSYLSLLSKQRSFLKGFHHKTEEDTINGNDVQLQRETNSHYSSANCINKWDETAFLQNDCFSEIIDHNSGKIDCGTMKISSEDNLFPEAAQQEDSLSNLNQEINKQMGLLKDSQICDHPPKNEDFSSKTSNAHFHEPKVNGMNSIRRADVDLDDSPSAIQSKPQSDEQGLCKVYRPLRSSFAILISEESGDYEPIDFYNEESSKFDYLIGLDQAMKSTQKSQSDLQMWDRQMGLKRCHSKTMTKSTHSRNKLRKLMVGPIEEQALQVNGIKQI